MSKDSLKGKWGEFKGEVKKKWEKFTDNDMIKSAGTRQKLAGDMPTKYRYSKDETEEEYHSFMKWEE